VVGFFFSHYVELKGERKLASYSRVDKYIGELAVTSIQGYKFELHCRELQYTYAFSNRLFQKKRYRYYSVYGVVIGEAPDRLREVLGRKTLIPPLVPAWVPWATARLYIIEAYVDTVLSLLMNEHPAKIVKEDGEDHTFFNVDTVIMTEDD
jgi:hypothetical protein